jgi:hypothetical protein
MKGPPQAHRRSARGHRNRRGTGQPGTSASAAGPVHPAGHAPARQAQPAARHGSAHQAPLGQAAQFRHGPRRYPDISRVLATPPDSVGCARGPDRRTTSDRPGPGGLLPEEQRMPPNPGSKRSGEPRLPPSRPGRSARGDHPARFMIADAVRYMSVHSRKQPDSHGHSRTPPGLEHQPATPGKPQATGHFRR